MNSFKLKITTPQKKLFEGPAQSVTVPGEEGIMTVLKGHVPLLSSLAKGEIKVIKTDTSEDTFKIDGGFMEVNEHAVSILLKEPPKEEDTPDANE